ncbi:MAG: hypothetical protein WBH20_09345 [Oceanisphaera sp.]|uniref:hypothetical protein n=1 Tax=Oceanisphaera sp. TaxID=1929979 RepID=UPI003C74B496
MSEKGKKITLGRALWMFIFIAIIWQMASTAIMANLNKKYTRENRGYFSEQGICAASIATMMGRPLSILRVDNTADGNIDGPIHFLHYVRPNDGSKWFYKCKIIKDKIIWGSNNSDSGGRWRTHELDDVITFKVENEVDLTINEHFSDGSSREKTFNLFDDIKLIDQDKVEDSKEHAPEIMKKLNSLKQ